MVNQESVGNGQASIRLRLRVFWPRKARSGHGLEQDQAGSSALSLRKKSKELSIQPNQVG